MKKLLFSVLSLILLIFLVSCSPEPCLTHGDADGDLICDACQEKLEKPNDENEDGEALALIKDGVACFQLVISKTSGTKILNSANNFIEKMKKLGVEITLVKDDSAENIRDCEIILGDVNSRGERYDFDEHTLGIKGEVITRIDNKIIVTAGSTGGIVDLFEDFCKNVIGLKNNVKKSDVQNVSFEKSKELLNVQDDYRVTAIKVGDVEISGYTIAFDPENQYQLDAARELQTTLYERAGYWLELVPTEKAGEKSFLFKSVKHDKNGEAGNDGFLIKTVSGQVQIVCAFDNSLRSALNAFIAKILVTNGEYVIKDNSTVITKEISVLYYKDYPEIKGDGKTNDFEAIRALHAYANESGQRVVAENGKEYYIEKTGGAFIEIQTDVDFGTATFIIDDRFITDGAETAAERTANIFRVTSKLEAVTYTTAKDPLEILKRINESGGLLRGVETIPLNLGYDVMIIPYDTSKRIYMRSGVGAGVQMSEIVVVRKDNSVDMKTTTFFDFEKVDKITIYPIDTEALTVKGGTFITISTRADMAQNYVSRNFVISRSNVVITGMEHIVENQPVGDGGTGSSGAPCTGLPGPNYSGWMYPTRCTDVIVTDCKFSGLVHYNQGSYDLGGNYANNLQYINCTQHNMFDENGKVYDENSKYWGIHGTNYCKNITFESCTLSRFDAHAGVYNFTIKNSKIGKINAVGGGVAIIENTTVYLTRLVGLRLDYASSWRGDFYIKDVNLVSDNNGFYLFGGTVLDADFGMKSYLPNVYVENVRCEKYDGTLHENLSLSLFRVSADSVELLSTGVGQKNTMNPAEWIKIKQQAGFEFTKIDAYDLPFTTYLSIEYLSYEE